MQFNHQTFEKAFKIFPETTELSELLDKAQYGIEFINVELDYIEQDFLNVRDSKGIERLSYFFKLLHKLNNWKSYKLLNTLRAKYEVNKDTIDKINVVVDYLYNNYTEKLDLNTAAQLLNMNSAYFSRFFHRATGQCFSKYLNRFRISRACYLLEASDKNISEICYEVGYNSLSNFNRRFFELKNLSPTQYRDTACQRHLL